MTAANYPEIIVAGTLIITLNTVEESQLMMSVHCLYRGLKFISIGQAVFQKSGLSHLGPRR
jgi:hypothetical protein